MFLCTFQIVCLINSGVVMKTIKMGDILRIGLDEDGLYVRERVNGFDENNIPCCSIDFFKISSEKDLEEVLVRLRKRLQVFCRK